jgi:hypothetical protein
MCQGIEVDEVKYSEEKEIAAGAMRSVRYDRMFETSLEESIVVTVAPMVREGIRARRRSGKDIRWKMRLKRGGRPGLRLWILTS